MENESKTGTSHVRAMTFICMLSENSIFRLPAPYYV
jgi:hypothetical protein